MAGFFMAAPPGQGWLQAAQASVQMARSLGPATVVDIGGCHRSQVMMTELVRRGSRLGTEQAGKPLRQGLQQWRTVEGAEHDSLPIFTTIYTVYTATRKHVNPEKP